MTSALEYPRLHNGYANHRLPKIGEFFILPPQGKQNFWKYNELNIKRLRFLVIFGHFWGLGRFKGAYMGSIIDE